MMLCPIEQHNPLDVKVGEYQIRAHLPNTSLIAVMSSLISSDQEKC